MTSLRIQTLFIALIPLDHDGKSHGNQSRITRVDSRVLRAYVRGFLPRMKYGKCQSSEVNHFQIPRMRLILK
jgi:hypothetical protein